ncbi:uncharacterized protein LOC34619014 [Cyclospora cayetanensis]|uniref:Uncharacterized protein LOC34619014 n=1 Tax=Cyclospora cayetanensis TaxID=88456 RepID=A0A6P6RQW4_9EIME|nr:uncharacterized protein LOC34619014 [Cyclospora cayetanensis]
MEKLPTIILPIGSDGDVTAASPRTASLGPWDQPKSPSRKSPLRLGGIRLRCSRPQQLVEDFYVKRLGMQELVLGASSGPHPGCALGDDLGAFKASLKESDGVPSWSGSRRTSFASQQSGRIASVGSSPSAQRFVAFEFFSTSEVEEAVMEALELGECSQSQRTSAPNAKTESFSVSANQTLLGVALFCSFSAPQKSWLGNSFGQFVLECVPVQKVQGLYKPYEHHRSDVFSRLSFCVSDVDAAALDLSQHMIRVQPAGQFLNMAYAASFLDPQNFRGRLLQFTSEYKMVSRKAYLSGEGKRFGSLSIEPPSRRRIGGADKDKRSISDVADELLLQNEEVEGTGRSPSALTSSFSSTSSSAASLFQAEREGCLPAPSAEDLKAGESEESFNRCHSIRFDTLPIERLPVLHHIEIVAADLEKALTFYEEVMGMTLIEKKTAHGFGFTLYYLACDTPTQTSYQYWLWLQRFSCICIRANDSSKTHRYRDLDPAECGFLGISFLCPESEEENLLKHFHSKSVNVNYVEDEVYGRKVMLLRDPQNVAIRIVVTN